MRSLSAKFRRIEEQHPHHGLYLCLVLAVIEGNFAPRTISEHFYKLIPKEDYLPSEAMELIRHLWKMSNHGKCREDNRLGNEFELDRENSKKDVSDRVEGEGGTPNATQVNNSLKRTLG